MTTAPIAYLEKEFSKQWAKSGYTRREMYVANGGR